MNREALCAHIEETYGVSPDQPWEDSPESWVFRRRDNGKWFALLMSVSPKHLGLKGTRPVDALNLKLPPEMIALLREEEGCFPAYHMNKRHWITLLPEGPLPAETVFRLLAISFDLAAHRKKTARPSDLS